jgi:hypothetical protein
MLQDCLDYIYSSMMIDLLRVPFGFQIASLFYQVHTAAGVVKDILELEMCPRQEFSSTEPPPDLAQLEVHMSLYVVPT